MFFSSIVFTSILYSALYSAKCDWVTKAFSGQSHPTKDSFPETAILDAKKKPSVAIAFGGGGVNAYSNTIGVLAALHKLDLIKDIRYIGGVSGGAWSAAGFTYDQTRVSDKVRLGKIVSPEDFANVNLSVLDPNCLLTRVGTDFENYGYYLIFQGVPPEQAYFETTYNSFFKTLGIEKNVPITYSEDTLRDIRTRNPSLKNVKFYLPVNKDRPFLLINGALIGPSSLLYPIGARNLTNYEFSSLYVGSAKKLRVAHSNSTYKVVDQTGGFIEPFALGEKAPNQGLGDKEGIKGLLKVPEIKTSDIIGLPIMAGISAFAPGLNYVSNPSSSNFGLKLPVWSVAQKNPKSVVNYMTDGGNYANQNIISFLQRKVKNIILVSTSSIPLQPFQVWNVTSDPRNINYIAEDVMSFWGALPINFQSSYYDYSKNQVFSFADWPRVVLGLQAAQAEGSGIVATFCLKTVKNEWWGIPEGFEVKLNAIHL